MDEQVGQRLQYDAFADEFLDHARNSVYNAHYDRPACLELLGEVAGKRVLDAACGPGLYAEELARRGAEVVGFDHSPRMIQICRDRWLRNGGNHFDVRVIQETWSKGRTVSYWLAPLQTTCDEIFRAGFVIERLVEPRPVPDAATVDAKDYEKLCSEPGFIAFRLVPRQLA